MIDTANKSYTGDGDDEARPSEKAPREEENSEQGRESRLDTTRGRAILITLLLLVVATIVVAMFVPLTTVQRRTATTLALHPYWGQQQQHQQPVPKQLQVFLSPQYEY
jgi:hypothetical protein